VLAAAIRLLDLGLFRIGGERYASENESFGLATLTREHVTSTARGIEFEYPAKSGQVSAFTVSDPMVCSVVRQLLKRQDDSPELLAWWDASSRSWRDVRSEHVNEHLKELTSEQTSAKDFRTWHGTVLMAMHLSHAIRNGERLTARCLTSLYRQVAGELGNTAAVTRNSYVNPEVVAKAERGEIINPHRKTAKELVPLAVSNEVLALLRKAEN
jgi:DNA topoisomerase IB